MEVLDQGRKRVKDLESQLDSLKHESQKQVKESQFKLDFLQQELKKNVNTQYIKNIILKFFHSEYAV